MMRWIAFTLMLLSTLALCGCGGGGGETLGIFGKVINRGTRLPIANAKVLLKQDGNEIATVQTNGSGKFAFPNLPAGDYTLVASADGYLDTQVRVTLAQGQRLSVTIEMISVQEGPPTDVPIAD
ncbi:MAG: carboxypeptidase-like regulatory domain-containing protein [Armatimonadetes bacterium]|nr:carboxypeptidase-like regulatory domain-containing protein [Armatimonadota bacterium]MCX7968137.1 carboxypeptidase-like regulatory domain-containing protein [Armatimonadota bacterium]MDW8142026.1 carboxypeptidase-like regulatory domain-containing protein [Armatimonadota bacterium]